MTKMRKVVGILLALMLVMGMTSTAFADTTSDYSITVPDNGHTYEVYQIFTGDLHEGKLSNVQWGANGNGSGEVSGTVLDTLEAITATTPDKDKLEVITPYANLGSTPKYVLNAETLSVKVDAGYYLIKDRDKTVTGNDAYTTYIVEVVGNVTIVPKADVPTVEKKVKDTNDSVAESTTDWQDSADYDIDDNVPFLLKATMGKKIVDYTTYKVVFNDTLSAGLVYNKDAVVKIDGTEVTTGYDVDYANNQLTITFDDVKGDAVKTEAGDVVKATADSIITVEYTAKLTGEAVVTGGAGNANTVTLTYSNNPAGNQTGTTPQDKVVVFTYKVVANKVSEELNEDGSNKALTGAGFTLYKANDKGEYAPVGGEVKGEALTTFEWKGLDDGNYKLVETTTPAGYNTIKDIVFTITADHDVTADAPTLTAIAGTVTAGEAEFTPSVANGSLSTTIINYSGAILPTTGGMGTTLLYLIGGLLVVAAGATLVMRRRAND